MPSILPTFIQTPRVEAAPPAAPNRESPPRGEGFPKALKRAERVKTTDAPLEAATERPDRATPAGRERADEAASRVDRPTAKERADAEPTNDVAPETDSPIDSAEPVVEEAGIAGEVAPAPDEAQAVPQSESGATPKNDAGEQPAEQRSGARRPVQDLSHQAALRDAAAQAPAPGATAATPDVAPTGDEADQGAQASPRAAARPIPAEQEAAAPTGSNEAEAAPAKDGRQPARAQAESIQPSAETPEQAERRAQTPSAQSADRPPEAAGERVAREPRTAERAEPRQHATFTVEEVAAAPVEQAAAAKPAEATKTETRVEPQRAGARVDSASAAGEAERGADDRRGADSGAGRDRGATGGESVRTAPAPAAVDAKGEGPTFTLGSSAESAQRPGGPAQTPAQSAERQAASEAFAASVSRGLAAAVNQRGGSVTMRLQPESLGSMRIQMTIERGVVHARFEVTTGEARDLLSQHMETLRSSLEARGLSVDRLQVQVTSGGQGGQGPQTGSHQQPGAGQEAQRGWQDAADGRSRGGHGGREGPDQDPGGGRGQGRWNRSEHGAWTSADDAGGARAFRVRVDAVG